MTPSDAFSILAAGLAIFLLGHVWYHAKVFGRSWMRLTNISPEVAERGRRYSFLYNLASLAAAMMIAATLAYASGKIGVFSLQDALTLASLAWAGFFLPALFGQILWEGKSIRLYLINAGYWLIALVFAMLILYATSA